nr:tetratricopeptide repeat protein [Candidatus Rhodobacter lobularis]
MAIRNILPAATALFLGAQAILPAQAQGVAGSYLAARQASSNSDFRIAADYFARAIIADPRNPVLMENAILAYISLGDGDRAAAVARRLLQVGASSQIAHMALLVDAFQRERFENVVEDIDAGMTIGPLVDGLLAGWAELGAGRMTGALERFNAMAESQGVEVFGLYHKALALAVVGDFEGAEEILSGDAAGPLQLSRRGVIAFAQVLSQLERNGDAVELIDATFGDDLDPGLQEVRGALEAGETLAFDTVRNAKDGAAEVFVVVAGALNGEANDSYTLLYARLAEILRPDHVDAILLGAAILESLNQHTLATQSYDKIPHDHPSFSAAEIGRAEALRQSGKTDAAIEVLKGLTELEPQNPEVHMTLGDALRREERYDEATKAYDAAIALYPEPGRMQWLAFFARGITHEREKRWDQAEADFRFALELNPGQPQVLNYLGYSFVEMGINLEEALGMIEEAVAAQPNSGYIVDSLGWVQFRMGQYQDAVVNLERATELLAVDPIINDHLGDAYWAVGRRVEAEFQWSRALSFEPEEKDAERIRRKLEVGLDVVLEEEREEPITFAAQDG